MWRVIWEPALLFLAPFIVYVGILLLRRRAPFSRRHWARGTVSVLTLVGLAAAIVFMLAYGLLAERYKGAYVPAHIENGRLVPGRME
jgi:amino acid transporter